MMAERSQSEQTMKVEVLPIQLKSRTFTPEPGIEPSLESQVSAQAEGHIHLLVQLWVIPTEDERAALQAAGIHLLSYIPQNTWLAWIPAQMDLQAISPTAVRWMGRLLPTDKISPALQAHGVASWATGQDGRALLDVHFFADVAADEARGIITGHSGQIQEDLSDFSHYLVWFPADAVNVLAAEDAVLWVDNAPPPKVALNDGARAAANVDSVQAGGLDGTDVDLGIWDGGRVDDTHADLSGRVTVVDTGASLGDHATHVAGTMAGDGSLSDSHGGSAQQWRGMAPGADVFSYDWNSPTTEHNGAINTYGIELSQNSWGNGVEEGNCSLYGDYTSWARDYDEIVTGVYTRSIPVVFAAGNERNDGDCGMDPNPPYPNYANILPPGGTAKNTITVGATNSDDNSMTTFSSWGPVDDGRLKPDVVAPGDESGVAAITSTVPDAFIDNEPSLDCDGFGDDFCYPYDEMQGTSMAAPVVSGIGALLIEQYHTTYGTEPLPSTVKALFIHTATDLDNGTSWYNPGPDYASGYGLVDAQAAVDAIVAQGVLEHHVANGETFSHTIELSQTVSSLKVTLVWDDPPAAVLADPTLVNNLDLELVEPNGTTIHYPWVLDPGNPSNNATTGVDSVNNVEQVYVTDPVTGTWTARVKGTNVPDGPQNYSLAGSGASVTTVYLPMVLRGYRIGPDPGFWAGAPEFYVTPDRAYVDDFAIYIDVASCGLNDYKITHTTPEPITNWQFSFSGSFYASGTFDSKTTASGTTGLDDYYISGCGYVYGGPWSWTATWQDSSQPASLSAEVVEPEPVAPGTASGEAYPATLVK